MCRRECLAGEQCEHIAICRPSAITHVLGKIGGMVLIDAGTRFNEISADLHRAYGPPARSNHDGAWWRLGDTAVRVTRESPLMRDTKLCSCECPECGATVRFDVEIDLGYAGNDAFGSGYDEIEADCPRCETTVFLDASVKTTGHKTLCQEAIR